MRYIWSLPNRVFHWGLVIFILIAYLSDDYLRLHIAVGIGVLSLVVFRILWGVLGIKYSDFKDWGKEPSHNKIASIVMGLILIDILLICITGLFSYFYNISEDIHEFFANSLYFLIALHLLGVSKEFLINKTNVFSIFNGYKKGEFESIKLNSFQKLISIILLTISLISPIVVFIFVDGNSDNYYELYEDD